MDGTDSPSGVERCQGQREAKPALINLRYCYVCLRSLQPNIAPFRVGYDVQPDGKPDDELILQSDGANSYISRNIHTMLHIRWN